MVDPIKQFNSGKGFKVTDSSPADSGEFEFYIQAVELEKSQYKSRSGEDQFQFKIINCLVDPDSDKDTFSVVYQNVNFTPNGEMRNPAFPEFTTKAGEVVAASQLYEILQACKAFDPEGYEAKKKAATTKEGTIDWGGFLKGLKFKFSAKVGKRTDGTGKYAIIQTSKQKKKDEEYFKKREAQSTASAPAVASPEVKGDNIINPDDLPF